MYINGLWNGANLPHKMLCLTYDDGPGEQTLSIAEYLQQENIRATFFVVGKYAVHCRELLGEVKKRGHIIGNHTYEHPDLPYYVSVNGDVQNQVLRTDAAIREFTGSTVFFRAPYGKWSPEVATGLNINLLASFNHIGPIHWDIDGIDCYYWQLEKTVEEAVAVYLKNITEKGKGIVVMHDHIADMDMVIRKNKTFELTRRLIPILKEQGYTFIGLDEIEELKNAASQSCKCNIRGTKGCYISADNGSSIMNVSGKSKTPSSEITLTDTGNGTVAMQAENGRYLSVENEGRMIKATHKMIHSNCIFHLIPVSDNRIMLRAESGHFLATGTDKQRCLTATAPHMRLAEIFTYLPLHSHTKTPVTLKMKYRLWKKRMAFIRSKIMSH